MLKYNAINWLDFGWDCLIKCSHAKTKPNHVTSLDSKVDKEASIMCYYLEAMNL